MPDGPHPAHHFTGISRGRRAGGAGSAGVRPAEGTDLGGVHGPVIELKTGEEAGSGFVVVVGQEQCFRAEAEAGGEGG